MRSQDILIKAGLKCTSQRINIINILKENGLPMTAEEIFKKTNRISLSTVYRALDLFSEKGITEKESICNSSELYYRLKTNSHCHYAICMHCHKMSRIPECPVHEINIDGFTVIGHKLEIYGYCPQCAEKYKKADTQ